MNPRKILDERLKEKPSGFWDVRSRLQHFGLINYALPAARLRPHIPERFEIPEFNIRGQRLALMSAVPFLDVDFYFINILPFIKFNFGQTNYRVYVFDTITQQHCVWFFGTTLGSPLVKIPRVGWRIPWHEAKYLSSFEYDSYHSRYTIYSFKAKSAWGKAEVEIEDTGLPLALGDGFSSLDEMKLILTHPLDGYFYRLDGKVGSYSVWHQEFSNLTLGKPKQLYFELYERLGLLSKTEMQEPHSIFISPQIDFHVFLPPK